MSESKSVSSPSDIETLAKSIGTAVVEASREAQGPRKVTFGEYNRKRLAGRPKLQGQVWQNDILVEEQQLTPVEIALLNRISRTGKYINRLVGVRLAIEGSGDRVVYLNYHNKTHDQRLENAQAWRGLPDMLKQIVEAQDAENLEDQERETAIRSIPRQKVK